MSKLNVEKKKSRRIFYLDALRALAIISVIIYHIFVRANFIVVGDYGIIPSFNWFFTDIMGTFFRCGVDIFLMLSGALSLGRIWDIKSFLGKRLPRIVEPFLFWLFVIGIGVLLLNLLCPSFFDGFKNLRVLVFDRPWNKECVLPDDNYTRCTGWEEIKNIVADAARR